jgi:hypothetical protein
VEGRYRGQCLFEAVVVASRILRTAVVDELSVRVGARVGSDEEAVAVAKRVLDRRLKRWILDTIQSTTADLARLWEVLESGWRVGAGYVVADVAQVRRVEVRGMPVTGRKAEVVAEAVSEDIRRVVRLPGVQIGRCTVDIDV